MSILKIIRKFDAVIAWCENVSLVSLLSFMCVVAFLQVVLRNLFNWGFPWADEILRHQVVWLALLGASLGIREERSIRIDILNRFLPPRINKYNETVLNLVGAVVCIFLIHASIEFLKMEKEYNELFSSIRIPVWKILLIYPISFGVIAFPSPRKGRSVWPVNGVSPFFSTG